MNDGEFEELPKVEPSWLRLQRATTLRKQLLAAGYTPLPCNGKAPPIPGWQDVVATSQLIDTWAHKYPGATNTGLLTDITPAIDIDVTHTEAASAVEALAREHFEEQGYILVRFGKAPKRAILLYTNEPFAKIARAFTARDGSTQKIEVLATGQQIVVAGIHPDTKRDYSWHGGEPGQVKRKELPYVRQDDMEKFVDAAAELLIKEFGFVPVGSRAKPDRDKQQTKTELPALASMPMRKPPWQDAPRSSPPPKPAAAMKPRIKLPTTWAAWPLAAGLSALMSKRHCSMPCTPMVA